MTSFKTLKESVSIQMVLEYYKLLDGLVERGESLRGNCPFCESDEGQPFSVSLKKNCFNSFCCSKHGNILDFVAEREHISIKQAADKLAEEFITKKGKTKKLNIPEVPAEVVAPNTIEEKPTRENKPLEFTLKGIDPLHEMVATLGISEQTARTFGAGFYTGRGMFKNHFVMPIYSYTGDLLAYTGIDKENPTVPMYPKQFNRDIELFSAYCLGEREQKDKALVICRHPLEVLILNQAGFEAVALMGNTINQEQVKLLLRSPGAESKLTLFLSKKDAEQVVETLSPLLVLFYIRLVQYNPNPNTIIGFTEDEAKEHLVL